MGTCTLVQYRNHWRASFRHRARCRNGRDLIHCPVRVHICIRRSDPIFRPPQDYVPAHVGAVRAERRITVE